MLFDKFLSRVSDEKLRRSATYASCTMALVLIAAKFVVYSMTNSVSILSSLFDSSMDLMASLVALFGVASALMPPDHDHRFGHGKAEPLAALAQSLFILASGVFLVLESVERFSHPQEIQNTSAGYAVMLLSMVLTFSLIRFQAFVISRTSSMSVSADSLHYSGDLMSNGAVILALLLHQLTGISFFDPLFALGIAGALVYNAWQIARDALDVLMDRELSQEDRLKIKKLTLAVHGVKGLHDLRTRSDSGRSFIEMHVEMDPAITLMQAHEIAEQAISAVKQAFENADVLVHMDPAGHDEHRLDRDIESRHAH